MKVAYAVVSVLVKADANKKLKPVVDLAEQFCESIFGEVRAEIVSKGFLKEETVLRILQSGRDDLRKLVLRARLSNLYSFPYGEAVASACDLAFAGKAQYWKIQLGGDPLSIFKEAMPPRNLVRLSGVPPSRYPSGDGEDGQDGDLDMASNLLAPD